MENHVRKDEFQDFLKREGVRNRSYMLLHHTNAALDEGSCSLALIRFSRGAPIRRFVYCSMEANSPSPVMKVILKLH